MAISHELLKCCKHFWCQCKLQPFVSKLHAFSLHALRHFGNMTSFVTYVNSLHPKIWDPGRGPIRFSVFTNFKLRDFSTKIHTTLCIVYRDTIVSHGTVCRWITLYTEGKQGVLREGVGATNFHLCTKHYIASPDLSGC